MSSLPQVVPEDPLAVSAECVAQFEALAGRTLYPADPDRLMVDLIAYRETIVRASINDAARQNLVKYAREPMLVVLGEMFETPRLPPQAARTTMAYTLDAPLAVETPILKGHRIEAETGALFATAYDVLIPAGGSTVQVLAYCDTPGSAANGLIPSAIASPFDALPEGLSVSNVTTSGGGAELEDLERFRERVKLAMSRASAGSKALYRYIAKTADIRVVDVSVEKIAPGRLRLAVLADGDADEVVAAVYRAVQADDNHPVTDTIDVLEASPVATPITVLITPLANVLPLNLQAPVDAALKAVQAKLKRTLGYDGVSSQIIAALQVIPGIKRVALSGADRLIKPNEFAVLSWSPPSYAEAEDA